MGEIEKIQGQTENDKKKLESILSKSRARLAEIGENQKRLLEKEQKILEIQITNFLENKFSAMQLKDREARKSEKIERARLAKTKEIRRRAEHLNALIRDKQRARRLGERELVQNSLKNFRETVEKERETAARPLPARSGSVPRPREETGSQQLFDEIFEHVRQFYGKYEEDTELIRRRVREQLQARLEGLGRRCARPHSAPRQDRTDELANQYIRKVKKYDSTKALQAQKHLKTLAAKERAFREVIKAKRGAMLENQRARIQGKREGQQRGEERAQKVLANRAGLLAAVAAKREATERKVGASQDRVLELHEGLVG